MNLSKRIMSSVLLLSFYVVVTLAQSAEYTSKIIPMSGERWWGSFVALGSQMPYGHNTPKYNLANQNFNNQVVPLMVSSMGRYIWSEEPFQFQFRNDTLIIESNAEKVIPTKAGTTLREAYLAASQTHFQSTGTLPNKLFFSKPQYNTWIELMYNQNEKDILAYAEKIVENGFPLGILMVDDNWQKSYGNFDFRADRFPNPKEMIEKLHEMGFKIMLWVCPFVSPDSPEYRELASRGYLIKDAKSGAPALIHWWNGVSACYDLTNPEAVKYLRGELDALVSDYGVDGFKFDAGDVSYMTGDYQFHQPDATITDFSEAWAKIGLNYPYNEFRASWKMGGQPLVQRLGDKDYSWGATELLIPDMIAAGLLGYSYTCPDMIGGGQFGSFLNISSDAFDEELIVRSCQIHALMPMMQFSVAPWRILNKRYLKICVEYAKLHVQFGDYILQTAEHAAITGEPILRNLEYEFPHEGYDLVKDQFMLGSDYMVAPMVEKGYKRVVRIPKGMWIDDLGEQHIGPKIIKTAVPIERLPYYKRIQK